jgi:hypothetical protein
MSLRKLMGLYRNMILWNRKIHEVKMRKIIKNKSYHFLSDIKNSMPVLWSAKSTINGPVNDNIIKILKKKKH